MTQEQLDKANEVKDEIAALKKKIYEAKHIEICHKGYGICKQYWDDILRLIWDEKEYREQADKTLFDFLAKYKKDYLTKIESLENEFNQL